MKSIPYHYDKNFNLIVEPADLFASEGFQEQMRACMKLSDLEKKKLDDIRSEGYQAYDRGLTLRDNPYRQDHKRGAWCDGWIEADTEYLYLLGGSNDFKR